MKKRFVVFFHLIPAIISLLLIGAHFLRSGNLLITAVSLLLILALGVREPLIARAVQVALLLATAEWVHVAFTLVSDRMQEGVPWTNVAIILGAVTALSLASIFLFLSSALKERYHLTFAQSKDLKSSMAAHDRAMSGLSQTKQATETENRQQLFAVHNLKSILTTCSVFTMLMMDYSIGLGMMTLIVIGLTNCALRTKMNRIGGVLPSEDQKKLYFRQICGLGLLALPILSYYYLSLTTMQHIIIVGSIITAFTLLLWAAAHYEYVWMRRQQ